MHTGCLGIPLPELAWLPLGPSSPMCCGRRFQITIAWWKTRRRHAEDVWKTFANHHSVVEDVEIFAELIGIYEFFVFF